MEFEYEEQNEQIDQEYVEDGGDTIDMDDVPVTQEDAWAVIR